MMTTILVVIGFHDATFLALILFLRLPSVIVSLYMCSAKYVLCIKFDLY
jgi:hypothetical protein